MNLRCTFLFALCFTSAPLVAAAQSGPDSTCYYNAKPGQVWRFTLPGGYRVELKRDADTTAVEHPCTIAVRNARDSIVWGGRGFGTTIDAWTGRDIDGDGTPDAVLGIDIGGGNRCCWGFTALRLVPAFKVIGELGFPAVFGLDARGRTVIYEVVPFYDLGPGMADAPSLVRVHQYRGGVLADITPESCTRLLTDTTYAVGSLRSDWDRAKPAMRAASRAASDTTKVTYVIAETRLAVISLVLQYFVCGRDAEATALAQDTWPAAQASRVVERLRAAIKGRGLSRD